MTQIKHDAQGFLVGELIAGQRELLDQHQAVHSIWKGIDKNVRLIARALGVTGRSRPPAEPSGRAAAAAPGGASGRTSHAQQPRDTSGRFIATLKAPAPRIAGVDAAELPAAVRSPRPGEPQHERSGAPALATAEATRSAHERDGRGRFKSGAGGEGTEGFGSKLEARLSGLGDAIRSLGNGADQIDPAITAVQEVKSVVEPLGRGIFTLFGRTSEKRKERWYKRLLDALKAKKPGEPMVASGGGSVGTGSFFGTLMGALVARVTAMFGGLAGAARGLLPMLGTVLMRILAPVAAAWAGWGIGQWIGEKIYKWLDESGLLTKAFDAFDAVYDTVSGAFTTVADSVRSAWTAVTDTFHKGLEAIAAIPEKVSAVLAAIDGGIRKIPVIGDVYGKAADVAKGAAASARKGYEEGRHPVEIQLPDGSKQRQQPAPAESMPQKIGRAAGAAARGVADAKDWVLGKTSERFESGGRGAGTVSTGKGDLGGASYGTYQLASKAGTLQKFLDATEYGKQFEGLKPGTAEFNARWQKVAREDSTFGVKQHDFIEKTHYQPQMEMLKKQGIDLSDRGAAVKDSVWSTSVQFGGSSSLISKALAGKDVRSMSDGDLVSAIQDYKIANNEKLFASSDANVRAGTAKRAEAEKTALLGLAGFSGQQQVASGPAAGETPGSAGGVQKVASAPLPKAAPVGVATPASSGTTERKQLDEVAARGFVSAYAGGAQTAGSAALSVPPVSIPAAVPEKLPAAEVVAMPAAAGDEKRPPARAVLRAPIGQDVGDRNIAHIVSGGIGGA